MNQNIPETGSTFDSTGEEPPIEPRHDEPQDPEDGPTKLAQITGRLIGHGMAHGAQREVDSNFAGFLEFATYNLAALIDASHCFYDTSSGTISPHTGLNILSNPAKN